MAISDIWKDGTQRIRDALSFAFSDPAWFSIYLRAALVMLIPIVGFIAILGWQRRVFEHLKLGRRNLPSIEFPADIRRGGSVFVMLLVFISVPVLLLLFLSLPLEGVGIDLKHHLSPQSIKILALAFVIFSYPELLRRMLAHGERFALLKPFPSIAAVVRAPVEFFLTIVGSVVAQLVAGFGVYAFVIGLFFTIPLGNILLAYIVVRWQEDVERTQAQNG